MHASVTPIDAGEEPMTFAAFGVRDICWPFADQEQPRERHRLGLLLRLLGVPEGSTHQLGRGPPRSAAQRARPSAVTKLLWDPALEPGPPTGTYFVAEKARNSRSRSPAEGRSVAACRRLRGEHYLQRPDQSAFGTVKLAPDWVTSPPAPMTTAFSE